MAPDRKKPDAMCENQSLTSSAEVTRLYENLLFPGVIRENWYMTESERIALTGVLARVRPRGALEVGVFHGGSLSLVAQFSERVLAIDNDPAVRDRFVLPENVELLVGNSQDLIPHALSSLQQLGIPLEYVLIDAEHSAEGVRRDLNLVLAYRPSTPMLILVHDSGNENCRKGILEADWNANPHVHFVQCDFVHGQIIEHSIQEGHGEVWGGLALAYLDPQPRQGDVVISQKSATMIRAAQFVARDLSVMDRAANAHTGQRQMISYAQNFEDVTLWRALRDIRNGHYVDVGALHPELDSVTKWFYDQGWSGINLEPVPEMFAVIKAARSRDINIQAAAGAAPAVAEMAVVPDSMGLSSLDVTSVSANVAFPHKIVEVEVRPLRDVLEPFAGQDIHFLKIDAEGTEHEVLLGMDFNRFRPWIVVIEATEPLSQTVSTEKWEGILTAANYQHAYFDGLNEFYVAAEKSELAQKLAVPPNVFDDFELATTARERAGREELHQLYNEAVKGNHRLEGEVARRDTELARVNGLLADVTSEVAKLQVELNQTRDALTATQTGLEAARTELAAAREEFTLEHMRLERSNREIEELTHEVRSSHAAIASLSEDLAELASELKKGREAENVYKKQLEQVLSSRSFRWLAPARRLRALLLPHHH